MSFGARFGGRLAALRGRRRRQALPAPHDAGAVAVEAALIIPVMVLMFAGVIEYGTMFRHGLSVSNAARQGARTAAQVGTTADADFRIVQSTLGSRGSLSTAQVDAIIIYKADAANGDIPASCISAWDSGANGVGGVCNVYRRSTGFLAQADPMPWSPATRQNDLYSGREFIGVYVATTFDSPLHLTVRNRSVADRVVFQFDPGSDQPMTIGGTLPPVPTSSTTTAPPTSTTTPSSSSSSSSSTPTTRATTTTRPTTTTTRPATTTTRR
ncbi:MAG: pilus assembly protein, partial [Acidimicrobiales bacterium]|nr:pilus assembly protein [Acidimicrobiales bacterium]